MEHACGVTVGVYVKLPSNFGQGIGLSAKEVILKFCSSTVNPFTPFTDLGDIPEHITASSTT